METPEQRAYRIFNQKQKALRVLKDALVECLRVLGEYTGPSMNCMNTAFENALSAIAKAEEGEN